MPVALKVCPRCQERSPVDAYQCARCGHQFRTQFAPPDQTRLDLGAAPTQQDLPPPARADSTERTVWMVWTAIGFLVSLPVLYGSIRAVRGGLALENETLTGMGTLFILAAAFGLTWLSLRFRRYYLEGAAPYELHGRRTRFAICLSVLLALTVLLALLSPLAPLRPRPLYPGVYTPSE